MPKKPDWMVDFEFKSLIPPLTDAEYADLKKSILGHGVEQPLILWEEERLLLDGHHRWDICWRNNIPFETKCISLPSRTAAKIWVIKNQFARRNITTYQRGVLALVLEPLEAEASKERQQEHGGTAPGKLKTLVPNLAPLNDHGKTRDKVAQAAGISHGTLDKIKAIETHGSEELKEKARTSKLSVDGAYKELRATEKAYAQRVRENEAAGIAVPADWLVTEDQTGVVCDALIADPPYGIINEPWEPEELEDFTYEWLRRWHKCGAHFIVSFFSQQHLWVGKRVFDGVLTDYCFQHLLVWHYPNNKSPQSRWEPKYTWEPIFLYRHMDSGRKVVPEKGKWGDDLTDFDCHVAAVPQSNFNGTEMKQHPAQKPLSVMRWLVNMLTRPGDLVVDPFCGSGTTGIAACQLGRRFHGIEIDPSFIELARRRIAVYASAELENRKPSPRDWPDTGEAEKISRLADMCEGL